ncbi:MAG: cytochrome c oxidase assembly protein [Acidimicrobiales bacterium]
MTPGAEAVRSRQPPAPPHHSLRAALLVVAGLLLVLWLVPPLAWWARHYEFVEALQFAFFAVVIPALAVIGSPWVRVGLASPRPPALDDDGYPLPPSEAARPVDRLAQGRRRHPEALRTACFASLYLAGAIVWRTPVTVNALRGHPWLVAVEAGTLIAVGVGLWLELAESPPLMPRLTRPGRVALAAISMWTIWILAYLVGLSHASWYQAYPHHAGTGFSLSADQQLTTGMLWFVSACAFVPVVYWNLIRWLQSEEDPDEELHHLMRQERIRGRTLGPGQPTP